MGVGSRGQGGRVFKQGTSIVIRGLKVVFLAIFANFRSFSVALPPPGKFSADALAARGGYWTVTSYKSSQLL